MELLKKIPFNFRYYLLTTTKNEIVILYIHTDFSIEENTETMLETNFLPILKYKYNFVDSQTIKISCTDDEKQLKDFNSSIREYCKSRPDATKIAFYSASPAYKIMFEAETMKVVFDCSDDLYFELGPEGSFKTGKDDFKQMEKIEVKSGQWFIDEETTIYVKEFKAIDLKIDEYSRGKHAGIFNLVIGEKFKGMRIQVYSTVQLNVLNSAKNPDDFEEGEISFAYINVFGEEILKDRDVARLEFHGFNSINLGCIEVSDEVKYGNILYLDNITKFNLMSIKRNINQVTEGSFVQIGRVGTVTLHNIQYNLTDQSTLADGAAIAKYIHFDNDKLEKSLNIYNTNISNSTGRKLIICKVTNTELQKVYISNCILSDGIIMLDRDANSKVTKFHYNECTFNSTGNFEIKDVISLTLNNVTFNIIGELKLSCTAITINGGKWIIGKLYINNTKDIISKLIMNKLNLKAEDIEIRNTVLEGEEDLTFYDTDCIIKANTYHIKGYKPSFTGTYFMCKKIDIEGLSIATLSNVKFGFDNGDTIVNIYSSLSGSFIIASNGLKDKTFALNLEDVNFFMNINLLDFNFVDSPCPNMIFKSNTPVKYTLNGYTNDHVTFAYSDKVNSNQPSKIIYKASLTDLRSDFKVFNDSEKLCSIEKKDDPEDQYASVFEITAK